MTALWSHGIAYWDVQTEAHFVRWRTNTFLKAHLRSNPSLETQRRRVVWSLSLSLSLTHTNLKTKTPSAFSKALVFFTSNITVFVVVQFLFITDLLSHSPYSSLSPSCFSCSLLNFISEFILRNPFGLQYLSFSFFASEYCKCLLISSFTLIYTKQVSS